MGMQLIETVELASASATINFQNIPQDGVDLMLKISSGDTNYNSYGELTFNNTYGNWYGKDLNGEGSAYSFPYSNASYAFFIIHNPNWTSNMWGNSEFYISNYTSNRHKACSADGTGENNGTAFALRSLGAWEWRNTSAITQINLTTQGSFVNKTVISLYMITAD